MAYRRPLPFWEMSWIPGWLSQEPCMALKLPEQFLEGETPPQVMWTILKSEYLVVLNHQTLFMILDNKLRLVLFWFQHVVCPSSPFLTYHVEFTLLTLPLMLLLQQNCFSICAGFCHLDSISESEHGFLCSYLFQKLWISFMAASNISLCFSNWHENGLPLNLLSYR